MAVRTCLNDLRKGKHEVLADDDQLIAQQAMPGDDPELAYMKRTYAREFHAAFTEALAFTCQDRDLEVLGLANNDPQSRALDALDTFWGAYEIGGVALVDMQMWSRRYAHPDATPTQLRKAALGNAKAGLPFTLALDRQGAVVALRLGVLTREQLDAAVQRARR